MKEPSNITQASAQTLADDRKEPVFIAQRWFPAEGTQTCIFFYPELESGDEILMGFLPGHAERPV
jgi:hypothetical protein